MSPIDLAIAVGLLIVIALQIALMMKVAGLHLPADLGAKLEALDLRLSDNVAIVQLSINGFREESAKSAQALREELATRVDQLGASLQQTLTTMGSQQTERFDAVGTEQTRRFDSFATQLGDHRSASAEDAKALRDEVSANLLALGRKVAENLDQASQKQTEALAGATATIKELTDKNEARQEALRQTVETRLDNIRNENAEKLEQMRVTVDEKLQGTLNERLGASFSQVNENLERVFRSVGEMQALATGVGDLKRVLSNIKSRGTWGEGTLGTLLEQVMTPEQYALNVEVQPHSGQRVEYAIKLPGQGDEPLWLPMDSKMPLGDYERLIEASDRGDIAAVDEAGKSLERSILNCARDICGKYVHPPYSTDFGVMFLPSEGLFAEVVRRPGLVDQLQRECRVIVTGPTTLMALLNSLRMGFRSLAIQQRSSEVWQVLAAVKTEFGKFGPVLEKIQKKLGEAQNVVEQARTRGRAMDRKLRDVEALPEAAARDLLAIAVSDLVDDDELEEQAAQ